MAEANVILHKVQKGKQISRVEGKSFRLHLIDLIHLRSEGSVEKRKNYWTFQHSI
jgi:hypothetical protein